MEMWVENQWGRVEVDGGGRRWMRWRSSMYV
jgi:hypothetical protein